MSEHPRTTDPRPLSAAELEEMDRLARELIAACEKERTVSEADGHGAAHDAYLAASEAEVNFSAFCSPERITSLVALARRGAETGELRKKWWLLHGCSIAALYGDDGEMQCNACGIDFKRWTVEEIDARITALQQERYRDDPTYRAKIDEVFAAFNPRAASLTETTEDTSDG